jgi:hypothetical protein
MNKPASRFFFGSAVQNTSTRFVQFMCGCVFWIGQSSTPELCGTHRRMLRRLRASYQTQR